MQLHAYIILIVAYIILYYMYIICYHVLRGSVSTVLTATG